MLKLARRTFALVVIVFALALTADFLTTPRYAGPPSDHFDGTRFFDPDFTRPALRALLRWQWQREPSGWQQRALTGPPQQPPPRETDALRVTMINHATLLLQFAGVNVLTDPIWSDHTGPYGAIGPRRYAAAGLNIDDLPNIDVIAVSHNHYDHMDMPSLQQLAQRDATTVFVVPLGNAAYLHAAGIVNVREIDWWQPMSLGTLRITSVPARHWSQRRAFDENRALWGGFVFAAGSRSVFFAGDTGAGPHFAQIRERLGAPDVALLPIGAYLPRWFMSGQHMAPADAIEAYAQLGARHAVAMHFGTFELADDSQDQARDEMLRLLGGRDEANAFWLPANGEQRVYFADP